MVEVRCGDGKEGIGDEIVCCIRRRGTEGPKEFGLLDFYLKLTIILIVHVEPEKEQLRDDIVGFVKRCCEEEKTAKEKSSAQSKL